MRDKHKLFDGYLNSICRLQHWNYWEVDEHIEEIEQLTLKLLTAFQEKIEEMPIDKNKKYLIASRILESLEDDKVYGQMAFRSVLLLAADTWEEYEILLDKAFRNTAMADDENYAIDFEVLVKKFLTEKKP